MKNEVVLTSVGIDIGTTTTQMVMSHLTLANVMPGNQIPKIEIANKSVSYVGQVYFTPFINREQVDGAALKRLISHEYDRAGIHPGNIDTGAVIITGETAKKANASEIIHSLAEFAGDFVVATAGPDLESIIAGKGSGAEELSRKNRSCIANIDIGGGTTNIAVFALGICIGTACINVGGRLLEVDPLSHRVRYIAPPARKIMRHLFGENNDFPSDGDEIDMEWLTKILTVMTECIDRVMFHETPLPLDKELIMTNSLPDRPIDGVVYSGGVAKYIYQPGQQQWWIHEDTGPLLAEIFRKSRTFNQIALKQGSETIHATVVGAGAHTVNVSGSTIAVSEHALPLRNVPAVYPETVHQNQDTCFTWRRSALKFTDSIYQTMALVIPELADTRFNTITRMAENLARELPFIAGSPKVIVTEQDIAKVLGQSLQHLIGPFPLVCIDGIALHTGDYLDIARPLPYQEAVPVIVKTLVFAR